MAGQAAGKKKRERGKNVKKNWFANNWLILVTGVVIGIAAVVLGANGNPGNMGFCIACFLRDTAGALGLHRAEVVQYFRPEIAGIIAGALIAAVAPKEFKGRGGSSPVLRFVLGAFVMIGALMFLGCPLRMVIRIGGGDGNALVGLVGFIVGILVGVVFLKKGFTLGRAYKEGAGEAAALPVVYILLFVLCLAVPALFFFSEKGPGSLRAPIILALIAGLVVGVLCQRSRMCMVGGIRNAVMFKDFGLVAGFLAVIVTVLVGNLIIGKFNPGFTGQPVAHNDGLWNFLGTALMGWASVLLGGCPLRQLILTGQGESDSAVTVLGMLVGAAFCHNFKLASSGDGPTGNGKIAVIIGFVVVLIISLLYTRKAAKES
ncbi:MAG: YedE-related selenium metabolism membrane protein [Oscillospiraceae bacterium]|nr:YedE-related selenium metabolism membrane protein [Oscillospiraceae bacterium]